MDYFTEEDYKYGRKKTESQKLYFPQGIQDKIQEDLSEADTLVLTGPPDPNAPYLEEILITKALKYNPKYGDDRVCLCGHTYYRHFDSYEHMSAIGCKYCPCNTFEEKKE